MLARLFTAYLLLAPIQIVARQATGPAQPKCILEGTAVDFASAEPLKKTTVRLVPSNFAALGHMAITDGAGHFHFEGIREGEYELTGERTGYVKSEFGARRPGGNGTPLRLKVGDKLTGIILKLARCAIVTGKVSSENGEPISRALVHAVRRDWVRGQPQYFSSGSTWTNDAGDYRIVDLPPGHYYLYAESDFESFVEKQGGQEKRIVERFYPGSPTLDGAVPLELQSGQDLTGVNFELHEEPVFHIRGRLVSLHDYFEDRLTVNAHPPGLGGGIVDLDSGIKGDGSFDFPGAPAGNYEVELLSDEYKQTIAKISVEVKKSDVNGLVLPVPNRFELKGVVHRLGMSSSVLSQLKVVAGDFGSPLMSHPYEGDVDADGTFKIENVWPGRYVFGLAREGEGDYVKSVQYGGREVLGVPIELANNSGQIEITISGGAGRIDGSIQPPSAGVSVGGLEVALVSEAPGIEDGGVLLAKTDQDGQFSFKNVAPGKYYAFAVADLDAGLLQSRSFAAQFQKNAIEIQLPENGSLQLRIPIVPDEDVQRALGLVGL